MKLRKIATLALLAPLAVTAQADDDVWFGAKAGTLGIGVEGTWAPMPYLDFRAGINAFSLDADGTEAGIDYDGDIDLRSFYATANLRMPLSPFRVTAGIFNNGNEINLTSASGNSFDIGGQTYTADQVGTLDAGVDFDSFAPYFGVGMDFRLGDTIGLNFDLGVLQQGSPSVAMSASGPIASDPQFQTELEAERLELEDELDDYDLYPVVSVGLSWNF